MRSDVKLIEQVIRIVGIIAILALLLVGGAILPASAASVWSMPITAIAGSEGSNPNLRLGTNTSATDGFDSGIDVPHAPPAPGATFDAYFSIVHPLFPQLDKDYRVPAVSIQWTLNVQSGTQQITLSWDASGVPVNVSLRLTGSGLNVDMKTTSNTTLPAGIYSLTIASTQTTTPTPEVTPTPTSTPEVMPTPSPTGSTPVTGITREVNGNITPGVSITLDGTGTVVSDQNGQFQIMATATGNLTVVAHKDGFRDRTQIVNMAGLGPGFAVTCNFQGQHGLIPNAPDIWYALDCVNLWLYPPNQETGLDIWTALDVINAWLYPVQ